MSPITKTLASVAVAALLSSPAGAQVRLGWMARGRHPERSDAAAPEGVAGDERGAWQIVEEKVQERSRSPIVSHGVTQGATKPVGHS